MAQRTITLVSARTLSRDVRELTFEPDPALPFEPGQWVSVKIPRADGSLLARSYSIASAPRADGRFDLAVTRVEGGEGSGWLHAARIGDSLAVSDAAGFFTLPEESPPPLLMVATGTGVAPLRAMIQRLFDGTSAPPRVTLLLGARTEADVIYGDEFRALASRVEGFRFERTLSRPDENTVGRTGYVQLHLAELVAELGACEAYVCGLNAMVREVRATLKDALGFTRERIHTERYD